jgi:hypothetical protein
MKIKVSNPMTKEIRKALDDIIETAAITKMSIEEYKWNVDLDVIYHEDDWDAEANKFKVIRITYPAECYAPPRYITTQDLNRVFRHSDRTYDGFFREIRNEYAI